MTQCFCCTRFLLHSIGRDCGERLGRSNFLKTASLHFAGELGLFSSSHFRSSLASSLQPRAARRSAAADECVFESHEPFVVKRGVSDYKDLA